MLLTKPVLLFGGKGGVGKTTLAAATALRLPGTLLISTDPAHNLGHVFGTRIGPEPTPVTADLDAVELDPERTVAAHLAQVERTLVTLTPERLHGEMRRHLELARHAPGTHEAALLDRVAQLVLAARDRYRHTVVDTAPTGHTLRLLALPEILTAWADGLLRRRDRADRFGELVRGFSEHARAERDARIRRTLAARRDRFSRFRELLTDAEQTGFALVTVPEPVPVTESLALAEALGGIGVRLAGVYINRCSPRNAGELLRQRAELEAAQLTRLRAAVAAPTQQLPLLADADPQRVAELL